MKFIIQIFLAIILTAFLTEGMTAQIKAVNDKGEKIILYPDGSWEYDTEESKIKDGSDKATQAAVFKIELAKAKKDASATLNQIRIELEDAKMSERIAKQELEEYESKIQMARKAGQFPKTRSEEVSHNAKLKRLKSTLKDAKDLRKDVEKREKSYKKLLSLDGQPFMTQYNKLENQRIALAQKAEKETDPKKSPSLKDRITSMTKKDEKEIDADAAKADFKKQLEKIKAGKDVDYSQNLEEAKRRSAELSRLQGTEFAGNYDTPCEMAFDDVDLFNGKRKRGTKKRVLFTFVDEQVEAIVKGKDFMVCEGFLSLVDEKEYILALTFTLSSSEAPEEYGELEKGSKILVKLMDGSTVTLRNRATDSGEVNQVANTTVYKGFYGLDKSAIRLLRESEVDRLRVVWGLGYEDYEVYELDFFIDQIACLKNSTK